MFVSDKLVDQAFEVLRSTDHAAARAGYEFSEKHLKVILAKAEMTANGKTVSERQSAALCSAEYESALTAFRGVAQLYYERRDKREAAAAIIDAWRTQQSDMRAMGRVG